jgi:transcriptional regulator with XRE-family HTH domain
VTKTPTWPEYLRRITDGLPPADIARRTGIPLSTVTRWLAGETKPSAAKLSQLSQFFPMRIDEAHAVVANYTPSPRAETAATVYVIDGQRIERTKLLRMYSDLEISRELVRRIDEHDSITTPQPFSDAWYDDSQNNVVRGDFGNVGGLDQDDVDIKQPPATQRTAAKKGTRKADQAPHVD